MKIHGSPCHVQLSRVLLKVVVFVLLLTSRVAATITVQDEHFESLPAAFGRTLEKKVEYKAHLQFLADNPPLCSGLNLDDIEDTGVRMQAAIHDANVKNSTKDLIIPRDGYPIALLVSRGSCSFEEKARVAQDLSGYVDFVVVYDDQPRSHLVPMSATDPNGIRIGMLFVSHTSGTLLQRALWEQSQETLDGGGLLISLNSVSPRHSILGPTSYNETQQFMLAALSGFFTLMACFGCLIVCVHTGYIHRDGNVIIFGRFPDADSPPRLLTEEDVMSFPEVQYVSDGVVRYTQEETEQVLPLNNDATTLEVRHDSFVDTACAICIDEYEAGESLRMLPCGHKFHTECIVPWLTERHASCPLCKHDIVVHGRQAEGESWLTTSQLAIVAWFQESRQRGQEMMQRMRHRRQDSDMLRHPLLQDVRSPPQPNNGQSATDDGDDNSVSIAT